MQLRHRRQIFADGVGDVFQRLFPGRALRMAAGQPRAGNAEPFVGLLNDNVIFHRAPIITLILNLKAGVLDNPEGVAERAQHRAIPVIPAQAGISSSPKSAEIPACAGMTKNNGNDEKIMGMTKNNGDDDGVKQTTYAKQRPEILRALMFRR